MEHNKSMYAAYLTEKFKNRFILENEYGFIEYILHDNGDIYIWNLYVKPEHRKTRKGAALEMELIKKHKPAFIFCEVDTKARNPETSLLAILSVGYILTGYRNDHIQLAKEIKYE